VSNRAAPEAGLGHGFGVEPGRGIGACTSTACSRTDSTSSDCASLLRSRRPWQVVRLAKSDYITGPGTGGRMLLSDVIAGAALKRPPTPASGCADQPRLYGAGRPGHPLRGRAEPAAARGAGAILPTTASSTGLHVRHVAGRQHPHLVNSGCRPEIEYVLATRAVLWSSARTTRRVATSSRVPSIAGGGRGRS